jgi:protein-S-isoprenylcysteine O-methyltransferase Ste14
LTRLSEKTFRIGGILLFTGIAIYRVTTIGSYTNFVLFGLELAVPLSILAAYLVRTPAVLSARGFRGIVLPLVASVLPLGLLTSPPCSFGEAHQQELLWLLCIPTALMVWAYASLRGSFAILADAREIRTGGPYAYIRHPAYSAQICCALVVLIWRFSLENLGLFCLFVGVQWERAKAEEEILTASDETYAAYARVTGRFFPGKQKSPPPDAGGPPLP